MGTLDAQGVYQYDEGDSVSPFSSFMNRLAESVTTQLAAIRALLAALRTDVDAKGTWEAYTPTLTGITLGTGSQVLIGRYARTGKTITAIVRVNLGTGGAVTGPITVGTPVPMASGQAQWGGQTPIGVARGNPGSDAMGTVVVDTATAVRIYSTSNGSRWGAGSPGVWAAGNVLAIQFTYESA